MAQIRELKAAGYNGPYSFEPFATEVQELADPQAALTESIGWIE
ncbi:hypothetical protein [Hydrogenophaga taeniospiralis]|nr:hypothetical protein [Hydrogenophaga taeniospiralis]